MKRLLILTFAILYHSASFGQVFKKQSKETAAAFVTRIIPANAKLVYAADDVNWLIPHKSIIYFYAIYTDNQKDQNGNAKHNLVGGILIQCDKSKYKLTLLDSIQGYKNPQIEAVFLCNANQDKEEELAVLFSFEMDPKVSKCTGRGYETHFYKKPDQDKQTNRINRVTTVGSFYGCDCRCMNNYEETASFKTPEAIMQELKRQGY